LSLWERLKGNETQFQNIDALAGNKPGGVGIYLMPDKKLSISESNSGKLN
jgi:hypothetical protein